MLVKDSVLKSLIALLGVFVLGYSSIITIHIIFKNIVDDLDYEIKNEYARYQIGEYILKEINSVERQYYQMAMSFNKRALLPIQKEIKKEIKEIKNAINILENGGLLKKYINLNIVGVSETVENIIFTPNKKIGYTFESIDLKPKLYAIEQKLKDMENIIQIKNDILNKQADETTDDKRFKIQIFFKTIPPLFTRMKENASRLLYESKQNLTTLEKNVIKERKHYENLEYFITLVVISFIFILGYIVIKQILRKSKELENLTKKAKTSAQEASNANEIKSKFLANMSHEIRTPLNAIIGFSELLLQSKLSSDDKEKADIIVKSAKALLNIINDILDLSKVESGKLEIFLENIDLKQTVSQVVELYSISAKQKDIRFIYNFEPNVPTTVQCDETRLKQVISNIISNAIKFTPKNGTVQFDIKLLEHKNNMAKIRFSVKDTGVGISTKNQKNIFEAFSQADNSVSKKYGGTGLGLSISSKIINLLDSKIHIISKENEGSRFYFDLDLYTDDKIIEQTPHFKYNFALCSVVDDNEYIRKNLLNILEDYGKVFDNFEDINNAPKIDLIFCFNGVSNFIDNIKKVHQKFHAPIIYVGNIHELNNDNNYILKEMMSFHIDIPLFGSKVFNIISEACNIDKQVSTETINYNDILKGKILVAEDNPNNQILIKILLEQHNLQVDMAADGKEAYELYKKHDYDLIFMDINMPIMDGLTSMKHIRSFEDKNNIKPIPIIALTANAIKGDKEKYISEGMNDYLSKPIDNKTLLKVLKFYLKQHNTKLPSQDENKSQNTILNENSKVQLLNPTIIAEKLGVSENISVMLINKFKIDTPNELHILKKLIDDEEQESISKKAHFIKNSCLNLSLDDACKLLQKLETDNLSIDEQKEIFDQLNSLISKYINS